MSYLGIVITYVFVQNFILVQFLGLCPFIGVSMICFVSLSNMKNTRLFIMEELLLSRVFRPVQGSSTDVKSVTIGKRIGLPYLLFLRNRVSYPKNTSSHNHDRN